VLHERKKLLLLFSLQNFAAVLLLKMIHFYTDLDEGEGRGDLK